MLTRAQKWLRRSRYDGLRRDCWRDWFSSDPELFARVYERNRRTLRDVDEWIREDVYWDSFACYGVPEKSLATLADIEKGVTYSDLIAFLTHGLNEVRYLEIGVSVGKNFLQVMNSVEDAEIWGLDIERINPLLEDHLNGEKLAWEGKTETPYVRRRDSQTRRKRPSLTEYEHAPNRNRVHYLSGDKFSPETWSQLAGVGLNLVLSDACHTPESIRSELGFLRPALLDQQDFIMLWDDLDARPMKRQFVANCEELRTWFPDGRARFGIYELFGTYGARNARPHPVGLFWLDPPGGAPPLP